MGRVENQNSLQRGGGQPYLSGRVEAVAKYRSGSYVNILKILRRLRLNSEVGLLGRLKDKKVRQGDFAVRAFPGISKYPTTRKFKIPSLKSPATKAQKYSSRRATIRAYIERMNQI